MNDTLWGVVIAGAISILTIIVNQLFNLLNKRVDRKTMLEEQKATFYNVKHIEALDEYYKCLSVMDTGRYNRESLQAFIAAHTKLSVFVTQDTLTVMEILVRKFEMSIAEDRLSHPDFNAFGFSLNLVRQLNAELNLAKEYKQFYAGKNKRRHHLRRKKTVRPIALSPR